MGEFRASSAVIREAELLAGSPGAAAAWVKERSHSSWYDQTDGDQQTELALLRMGSRPVDLALARYGRNSDVLQELYGRGDLPLRAAALANDAYLEEAFIRPWSFTGAPHDDFSWVAGLGDVEFHAFFSNPALPDTLVSDFFEQKGAWVPLDDNRRQLAIAAMASNLANRKEKDSWDGWANYSHGKVFDAAWRLSAHVPATSVWSAILARLYDRLPGEAFSGFDPIEVSRRWFPAGGEVHPWDDEKAYPKSGALSSYQLGRSSLARLAASARGDRPRLELLSYSDLAIRCGACRVLKLDAAGIADAVAKDGAAAAFALMENDSVWRRLTTREALQHACWAVPDPDSNMRVPYTFSERDKLRRERFPHWFADEELAPDDTPQVSVSAEITQLRQELSNLQKTIHESRAVAVGAAVAFALVYLIHH